MGQDTVTSQPTAAQGETRESTPRPCPSPVPSPFLCWPLPLATRGQTEDQAGSLEDTGQGARFQSTTWQAARSGGAAEGNRPAWAIPTMATSPVARALASPSVTSQPPLLFPGPPADDLRQSYRQLGPCNALINASRQRHQKTGPELVWSATGLPLASLRVANLPLPPHCPLASAHPVLPWKPEGDGSGLHTGRRARPPVSPRPGASASCWVCDLL